MARNRKQYTSGGIPLAVAIIVTQIAAVAWRIIGPFGFLSNDRDHPVDAVNRTSYVVVFWHTFAIRYNRRRKRSRQDAIPPD